MANNKYAAMSDAEKDEQLKKYKKTAKIGKIIFFAGLAIAILLPTLILLFSAIFDKTLSTLSTIYVEPIGTLAIMVGSVVTLVGVVKSRAIANTGILQSALEDVFDDVKYSNYKHISKSDIDSAGFRFSYNRIDGSDHVYAKYKGLNIEMSNIELGDMSSADDYYFTVFKGLWLICDFGRKLTADVRIKERDMLGKKLGKDGIQTDNEQFNKQFYIESDNAEEAFYILTPHMMEYIVQLDAKANARTNISFMKNGKLHVALNSGKFAFAVKGDSSSVEKVKEKFVNEARHITDLIDELRIMNGIFEE